MRHGFVFLVTVLAFTIASCNAQALTCEKKLPHCGPPNASTCNIPDGFGGNFCVTGSWSGPVDCSKELTNGYWVNGSHKNPANPRCPAASQIGQTGCTDDFFRNPSSWDYVAQSADYQALWYGNTGHLLHDGSGPWLDTYHVTLLQAIGQNVYTNVSAILYIDINIAWSTLDYQTIGIYKTRNEGTQPPPPPAPWDAYGASLSGNWPNGTLQYVRLYTDPEDGLSWTTAEMANAPMVWTIRMMNDIDATHRGVFIHSITSTVGYTFSGATCPP